VLLGKNKLSSIHGVTNCGHVRTYVSIRTSATPITLQTPSIPIIRVTFV